MRLGSPHRRRFENWTTRMPKEPETSLIWFHCAYQYFTFRGTKQALCCRADRLRWRECAWQGMCQQTSKRKQKGSVDTVKMKCHVFVHSMGATCLCWTDPGTSKCWLCFLSKCLFSLLYSLLIFSSMFNMLQMPISWLLLGNSIRFLILDNKRYIYSSILTYGCRQKSWWGAQFLGF